MSGGRSFPLRAAWPLVAFPVAKLAIHLATIGGYGIFRDELYYLACSRRLAWGYVDQPPFSIALLAIQRGLFGESLFALRILPALAGAGIVLVVGLMTRRFGGGALAQSIAMACALAAPHALAIHHFYSMNAFDGLVWALAAWLLVDLLAEPERRTRGWLALGALLGSGLLNKVSVLWLGAGMAVGLALSPARRSLRTPGPWLAAVLALLVFLPHLAWQAANGWPTLEFIANATGEKMAHISPGAFLLRQVEMMNSFSVIIWTGGLVWLARKPQWRALAWIWLTVLVILVVNGASRPGYLAPAYAWLFAAGGVGWESEIDRRPWFSRVRWALPVAVLAFGALFAPLALPLLSVERYVAYAARMGQAPSTDERKQLGELPQ
ncbi:MAG TPA: glycosyltransferase family 39 protein, partial [Thermoanaerobaculia bacterium]